jgi:ABC-2 type transport system permease protein
MTQPTATHAAPLPNQAVAAPRKLPRQGLNLAGLATLFWLTFRQHARARKLLVLAFVFTLPAVVALLIRHFTPETRLPGLEFGLVFNVIPHVMVTLTALLYATAMIQDEIEEQTLTYLLVRPLPKWGSYLTKLLATLLLVILLAGFFTMLTEVVIYWGAPEWSAQLAPMRLLKTVGLITLTLTAYCALFGCMSLVVRYALFAGLLYSVVFEGILANVDFAVRKLTVMYYIRVLFERWLQPDWTKIVGNDYNPWGIKLSEAPSAGACLMTVLGASLVLTLIAMAAFTHREFRVKTPEGS